MKRENCFVLNFCKCNQYYLIYYYGIYFKSPYFQIDVFFYFFPSEEQLFMELKEAHQLERIIYLNQSSFSLSEQPVRKSLSSSISQFFRKMSPSTVRRHGRAHSASRLHILSTTRQSSVDSVASSGSYQSEF